MLHSTGQATLTNFSKELNELNEFIFNKSMPDSFKDFQLESYNIEVPQCLIAQYPREAREDSRLMVLYRDSGTLKHTSFSRINEFLPRGSLLVANNSKVFPARLRGTKTRTGGRVEFLLTTPLPLLQIESLDKGWKQAKAEGLLRPSRRLRGSERLDFSPDLVFRVQEQHDYGQVEGVLFWRGNLEVILDRAGTTPLPPYIKRQEERMDRDRYQTVFAKEEKKGSAASPTAGLHFSREIFDTLAETNIQWREITLHVGYGTFSPLREQDIRKHRMHAEYVEIPEETAVAVNQARKEGRPVTALGTTSTRALESAAFEDGTIEPWQGWSDLYIYPGYRFRVVDHMITNFHLPGSSLILMVSAFAGREQLLRAYKNAIQNNYWFFSYGDAMLIL